METVNLQQKFAKVLRALQATYYRRGERLPRKGC